MPSLGPGELIIILAIALVIFGPGKLPELGNAVGKGIREFRKATTEVTREVNETLDEVKKPIEEVRKPIEDLRKPIEDLKRFPSEALMGPAAGTATRGVEKPCPKCSTANPAANRVCAKCGAEMA